MSHYLLPANLGNAIVTYLHTKPFGEVRRIIEAMEALVEHKPAAPDPAVVEPQKVEHKPAAPDPAVVEPQKVE